MTDRLLPDYQFVLERELNEAVRLALSTASKWDPKEKKNSAKSIQVSGELLEIVKRFASTSDARLTRLRSGNWQFGCGGTHNGNGTDNCPRKEHHHHDEFCEHPSKRELIAAGIDPAKFRAESRR